jgi:hypothetical protein
VVELPSRPLRSGDSVRIVGGIFAGQLALYAGMRGPERVAVLLGVLGRVVLPIDAIELV